MALETLLKLKNPENASLRRHFEFNCEFSKVFLQWNSRGTKQLLIPAFAIRHPAIVRHKVLIIEELLLVLESQTFYVKQPQGGFFASFF